MVSTNKHSNSTTTTTTNNNNPNPNPNPNPTLKLSKPCAPENPKNPNSSGDIDDKSPSAAPKSPLSIAGSDIDEKLRRSAALSRPELLLRRSRRLKQLSGLYRRHYWALVEELRLKYRQYYWEFGVSPFRHDDAATSATAAAADALVAEGSGENSHRADERIGSDFGRERDGPRSFGGSSRCTSAGCKSKAMALTAYCHQHILSDSKQKLYKACSYVIKSAQTGPVICGKPVLRAAVPSLCSVHFQKAQRHVSQALKKAGFNTSSSTKPAPKFHVIIAEFVRQIQLKRRESRKPVVENPMPRITVENPVVKEEHVN